MNTPLSDNLTTLDLSALSLTELHQLHRAIRRRLDNETARRSEGPTDALKRFEDNLRREAQEYQRRDPRIIRL